MNIYIYKWDAQKTSAEQSATGLKLLGYALKTDFDAEYSEPFRIGSQGKPYFTDLPYFFNISHCKVAAACAVSEREIGLDIQDFRPYKERLGARCCGAEELSEIARSEDKSRSFAKLWSMKEAYAKYTGNGWAEGFPTIETATLEQSGRLFCKLFDDFALALMSDKALEEKPNIIFLNSII